MSGKKPRKPNWTDGEMEVLAESFLNSAKILRGKLTPNLTADMKKAEWLKISERISSVAMCNRTVDETKKRWQDAQSAVKKKESFRRKVANRTGGGPPPDVPMKPWELTVLQGIPDVAISGIEGAVDTGLIDCGRVTEISSPEPTDVCPSNSILSVLETDADEEDDGEETCRMFVAETPLKESNTGHRCKSKRKSISFEEDPTYERLISLKERRLAVEERKAKALERIASALENISASHDHDLTVLSPIIKI